MGTPEKTVLVKAYERDFTLAIEEHWARGFYDFLIPRLGVAPPFPTFTVFFATEENLQIWEHEAAIHWLLDRFLELNQNGTEHIESVFAEYLPLLAKLEARWHAGPTGDPAELSAYVTLLKDAISLFSLWYYPGTDSRTPKEVMDIIMPVREKDEFFARNDLYVKDCAELLGVKREYVNLILADEFPDVPPEDVLLARASGVISLDGRERSFMPLRDFAKEHPEYEFEGLFVDIEHMSELRGQIAQKGRVTGTVRIVKNKMQMTNVKEGDIIVSPMTTPDFLPAMKKAAAFVTNEGGVMCHAAIVAREMKKPCVIGTKIATQVFKDGDTAEVDADTGIVRKL